MITPARRVTLRREFPRCSFTRNLSHKYTGHGSELLLLTFWTILGSGQKLLARLLDEHPFVTVKQPSNYIRHVSLFSEAWYEEESLETNRLNEGGISKEVLLDTLQVCSKIITSKINSRSKSRQVTLHRKIRPFSRPVPIGSRYHNLWSISYGPWHYHAPLWNYL